MAVTLSDTFTAADGTLLSAHDPDTGDAGSWEAMAFGVGGTSPNDDLEISSNRVQTLNEGGSDAIGAVCRNDTDPGADEYDVDVVMRTRDSTQNNRYTAVLWRMTPSGTANGDVDRYLLLLNGNAGEWQLYKIVSGSLTLLGSDAANYAASTTYDVHVEVRSSGTTMSVSVDDGGGLTEILTSTDTDITQRGRVGVSTNRSGDGDIWLDDLSVDSVTAGTTPEVTATIPLTLDVAPTATVTHQAQASVPLTLDVAAESTATHQATAGIGLTLDVAATAQAQHQVAATVALTVGIAPQAATQHSATAAIPLTLDIALVTNDGEVLFTPTSRTSAVQAEDRTFEVAAENRAFEVAAEARVTEVR